MALRIAEFFGAWFELTRRSELDERGMPGRFIRADGSLVVNDSWERPCT